MTPQQIKSTWHHYHDMFGTNLEARTMDLLRSVWTLEDLDAIEDQLSAGEFDAAEAVLENL